jgi:hypothetical protein
MGAAGSRAAGGYVPKSREAKVLTGMHGTMWNDTKSYQWVKVTASVFRR